MSKDVINVMTKRLSCIMLADNAVDNTSHRRTKQTIFLTEIMNWKGNCSNW